MKRPLKATICNKAHPAYGAVSLPFPIKLEEYDENLKMLDALGIGDPIEQDCFVDEIESPHLILERLKGNRINLDELDFLAKQLNRFSEREMVDFEGSVLLQKATELPELINIALSCSNTIRGFENSRISARKSSLLKTTGMLPLDKLKAQRLCRPLWMPCPMEREP